MTDFDYIKPESLESAVKILLEDKNSRVLAGGTDLFVKIRGGRIRPKKVVDIKGIPGLDEITWDEEGLSIGATATWTQINENERIKKHFPALIQASSSFGCYDIRNRATLGGNLANGAPGAEGGSPSLIYDAEVKIFGTGGYRTIPVEKFLLGPGKTDLKEGEILTSIIFPLFPAGTKSAYRRASRVKGQDLATCALSVLVLNPDEVVSRKVRVALSAVARTPICPAELTTILSYKEINGEVLELAKVWIKGNLYPRASSLRGSPDYKKLVLGGMLEDILLDFDMISKPEKVE
ncbi:MAG: xanthine dehydrogenase family protein subunit M [Candidatus Eremiobacteraeota bacterium]|nr:xanthine dehydrogenase family protein subunit M [Candidatus Eremiobacteraeota bacterium]